MESIEKKIKIAVNQLSKEFEASPQLKSFEKVNAEFESWVQKGVVKKRGNQLLSSSENHLKSQVWFNVKKKTVANNG